MQSTLRRAGSIHTRQIAGHWLAPAQWSPGIGRSCAIQNAPQGFLDGQQRHRPEPSCCRLCPLRSAVRARDQPPDLPPVLEMPDRAVSHHLVGRLGHVKIVRQARPTAVRFPTLRVSRNQRAHLGSVRQRSRHSPRRTTAMGTGCSAYSHDAGDAARAHFGAFPRVPPVHISRTAVRWPC